MVKGEIELNPRMKQLIKKPTSTFLYKALKVECVIVTTHLSSLDNEENSYCILTLSLFSGLLTISIVACFHHLL